ncbi:hypothetical protein [Aquimarina litoralis]|uniref:hypothetical protein n=1 Tax=Aquimarina litoralis TaxID=584605 RepID=UPI001C562783|nr:hypothetical protein [Aquimarina litoralis]MBW1298836.1 hypothetical protein [Aquimarina litoralis]
MLFRIKSYFLFLLKSTNQHGVHSPFIYNLVTKCLYDRKKRKSYNKIKSIIQSSPNIGINLSSGKILNRVIPYFNYQNILVIEKKSNTISQIASLDNTISVHNSTEENQYFDLIFLDIDTYKADTDILEVIIEKTHNDSLLLINSIRSSTENLKIWESIQKRSKVTVTVDIYSLGFVFFRTEQAKEHFTIRK